ncbi:hypothetical protein BN946_scf184969.g40 [Trametes cinnabarina]|uniref:Uncharacterized protein n=1 Tax=Pycnoporus cinnabarinus TaxID=5643 RepID=A0A060SZK1_PYCCI|nr:hypothetical protein BN946_scf184969.g40 [Trametes cinnabarina]
MSLSALLLDAPVPEAGGHSMPLALLLFSCSLTLAVVSVTIVLKPYRQPNLTPSVVNGQNDPGNQEQSSVHPPPVSHLTASLSQQSPSSNEKPPPPPARSKTFALQPMKAAEQIDRALRRTRSFSVHVLANSAKTLKTGPLTLKNQIASKGKTVLHKRGLTQHQLPAPIVEESSSSHEGVSSCLNSDQSSSDGDRLSDSTTSSAGVSSASAAPVSHAPTKTKARRTPRQISARSSSTRARSTNTRSNSTRSTRTRSTRTRSTRTRSTRTRSTRTHAPRNKLAMPPRSAPSTSERRAQPGKKSQQVKDPRSSLRIRGGRQPDEPIRYSRPACPENMLPGVFYETRYENPIKTIFNSKKKGGAGE